LSRFPATMALAVAALLAAPLGWHSARAQVPTPEAPPASTGAPGGGSVPAPLTFNAVRSFSGPENTRIVFELSRAAVFVTPDSGMSKALVISLPGEAAARAAGVAEILAVRDGVVDSVVTETRVDGASIRLSFRDPSNFRVLTLPAQDEQPFRLVVDVTRPGAEQAEARRLEQIAAGKRRDRVRVVAVDAGHGGDDAGARGPRKLRVVEKNVTLAVARALVDELNKVPGVRGELIRDGDYFIPLRDRYHAAEKMKADVFISIHANSTKRRNTGRGTEIYFLSLRGASDQADADLSDTENAADLVGGVPSQAENGLVNILYDVKRSSALEQSQLLAETLLDHVASDRRIESRGVKQAAFVVLKSVEFPSVLVETAFINNPVEARLLMSKEFQQKMATQLAAGVRKYFERNGVGLSGGNGLQ
jgi:N-acetylmuramoyl-L-alanine amidase